jgi:hypothetical protein
MRLKVLLNEFSFVDPTYNTFFQNVASTKSILNVYFFRNCFQNPKHFSKFYQTNAFA